MPLGPTLAAGIEYDRRQHRRWKARLAELAEKLADVPERRRGDVLPLRFLVHAHSGEQRSLLTDDARTVHGQSFVLVRKTASLSNWLVKSQGFGFR